MIGPAWGKRSAGRREFDRRAGPWFEWRREWPPPWQARLQSRSARWLVELEEDAQGSLERAAESDQPACLREVNLGVVRHQRGACRVEAETRELIESPDARAKLLGLARLDLGLDLLGLFHDTLRIDSQARPVMGHPAHRHVVPGTARRDAGTARRKGCALEFIGG